jgi:hypothetical protein
MAAKQEREPVVVAVRREPVVRQEPVAAIWVGAQISPQRYRITPR